MSCCGSLFVNLGGGGGGTVNTGVLQIAGGVALDSTIRFVEDQNGTDSTLRLNTSQVQVVGNSDGSLPSIFRMIPATTIPTYGAFFTANYDNNQWLTIGKGTSEYLKFGDDKIFTEKTLAIGSGTITTNGVLTVKGAGANIASFRNNSNIQVFEFDTNGGFTAASYVAPGSGVRIYGISSGVLQIVDSAYSDFNLLYFGSATTNYPAFKFGNTPANVSFRDATDTNYIGFVAGYQSSKTIEIIAVSGAMGLGFFNTPAINQPTTAIAAATYANVSGTEIKDADTFDGYTVGQVVKALRNLGLLT
jgi:hypothetical protein